MKSFREFLLEATMDLKTALSIFGLSKAPDSKAELNKLYKQLAMDNHPDRGGSTEKMVQINAAKEVIGKNLGKAASNGSGIFTSHDYDPMDGYPTKEENEKYFREKQEAYRQLYPLMEKFDVKLYAKYFGEIFGTPFDFKYIWNPEFDINYPSSPMKEVEFFNKDRIVILNVHAAFDLEASIKRTRNVLGGGKIVPEYHYSSFAVIKGKKQIITKKTIKRGNIDFTTNPEVIFPRARMEKLASGSVRKNSALKKRDFDALFTVKYPIDASRDFMGHIYGKNENGRALVVGVQRATVSRQSFYRLLLFIKDAETRFVEDDHEQEILEKSFGGMNQAFMPENQTTYDFFDKVLALAKKKTTSKKDFVKFYVTLHNKMFSKDE